jgi:thioredoxin 1
VHPRQIASDKPAVFDFWATWCGPCKIISPIFEKFAEEYTSVGFYKVDVDDQTEISEEVGVRAVRPFLLPAFSER